MSDLYTDIPGQTEAIAALLAASKRPVHAYLLVGPPGTGKLAAATAFAASLLCEDGGDGTCDTCRRVTEGIHPDVITVEREGATISIAMAQEISRLATRSPLEGARKILVLPDFHTVKEAGPALLKTIEEPPPSTFFVILADHLPPELVTIASRCVRIDFAPLTDADLICALRARGIDEHTASALTAAAGGQLDRALLLATDTELQQRLNLWRSIPERLDGTGNTIARLVDEITAALDTSVAPLVARQEEQAAAAEAAAIEAASINGKKPRGKAAANKQLEERHKREQRRHRTDEIRAGLATLARAHQARALAAQDRRTITRTHEAVKLIDTYSANLAYNPSEQLALQALLIRLDQLH